MKKGSSLLLALIICLAGMMFSSALAASSGSFVYPTTSLSPNLKCPVQPAIYTKPRSYDTAAAKANNMAKGLSAKQINSASPGRHFGLYFKFTPARSATGYVIRRIDFVISDTNGQILNVYGIDTTVTCQGGYYWYWDFFPLDELYDALRGINGEVVPGKFVLDLYFNSLWAGRTTVSIGK